jgi:AcrR family transcriptional regulator
LTRREEWITRCETNDVTSAALKTFDGPALPYGRMPSDGARREEILHTAATLFASSGSRTSLAEIADACGILPGSLYHHFDSKEAILVELVHRYHDDLERIAKEARDGLYEPDPRPARDRILDFGRAIAACGVEHRAALLLTLYEPPVAVDGELAPQSLQTPAVIRTAMLELLRAGRKSGEIRAGIDLSLLADRLCQSMLHVGVGVSHLTPGGEQDPEVRIRILLEGLAVRAPSNTALDRSNALRAARRAIAAWSGDRKEDDDRLAHLRSVARVEFGRRGYEATTMRDIASAAGLSTGTVYRLLGSKDELLMSIMSAYSQKVVTAWEAVVRSESSPLSKLDALMWVAINVVDRFSDEVKVTLAWMRQSPPSTPSSPSPPSLGVSVPTQLRHVKALVSAGIQAGEILFDGASADVRARSVLEAVWGAGSPVTAAGTLAAQTLARETVLRGASVRS